MPVNDRTVSTRFGRIAVSESTGDGFPVLLLHGSGASRKAFARQMSSPLAERFRLIALDLPGHGDSADASGSEAYGLPWLAGAVAAVIDALGLSHVAVYGWSLGGHIAIEVLSFHAAIAGLMLSGAPPVSKGPLGMLRGFHTGWDMLLASKGHFSDRDVERFGKMCFGDRPPQAFLEDIRRADGRCRTNFGRSLLRGEGADQRRVVETAEVPIAIVNGEHEHIVRLSYLESLNYQMLWGDKCQLIAGAGHSPFWQQPERFNALLGQFAADVARFAANPKPALVRASAG
ncbi:MAG: alpha/beta hydrolase [Devosia sp.]|nr:alpha/beta hydrolase [Devosia sp.]